MTDRRSANTRRHVAACLALVIALMGCSPSFNLTNPFSQSHEWVGHGLPNLMRVSDRLYRGGQPSCDGLRKLKEMGVKTVVNLRSSRGAKDREDEECRKLGMRYEHLRMPAFDSVPEPVLKRFFELVDSPETSPVFIHCMTGTDRVAVLMAVYRIRHDRWSADQAYAEMKQTGFNQFMGQYREFVYAFAAKEQEGAARANGSPGAGRPAGAPRPAERLDP
jgi:tyrosine-protein phosphatase SIW14